MADIQLRESVDYIQDLGMIKSSANRFSVPLNRKTYDAFPFVVQYRGTTYLTVKTGPGHANDGQLVLKKSNNGGGRWDAPLNIKIGGSQVNDGEAITIGVTEVTKPDNTKNARLLISSTHGADNYGKIHFAYSDTLDENFTSAPAVSYPAGFVRGAPHTRMIVLPSGAILQFAFAYNLTTQKSIAYLIKSDDGGKTWANYTTMMLGNMGSADFYGTHGWVNETGLVVVSRGQADADTVLMAIVRNEDNPSYRYQLVSYNGGATWTNLSDQQQMPAFNEINATPSSSAPYPVDLFKHGEYIYAVWGHRGFNHSTQTASSEIRWTRAKADYIFDKPNGWGVNYGILFRGLTPYKDTPNGFGYPVFFVDAQGELKIIFYDNAVEGVPGSPDKFIRLICMAVENNHYFDSYARINKSINSGVETLLPTPEVWLDSDIAYNRANSQIIIQQDGWYDFHAQAQLDVAPQGIFDLRLYRIDTGLEAADIARQNLNQPPAYNFGKRLITHRTIGIHQSNYDLNINQISKGCYCYAGERIELYAKQNSGAPALIFNEVGENRTMLTFKKRD